MFKFERKKFYFQEKIGNFEKRNDPLRINFIYGETIFLLKISSFNFSPDNLVFFFLNRITRSKKKEAFKL